jgi:arsenite transporter
MHIDLTALNRLGGYLKNHMGISGFIAMAAGLIVGNITVLEPLRYLIPVALFLMLYPSMLDVRPEGLAAVLAAPRLPVIALAMNFVISPVMIGGLSHLFSLHDTPAVLAGITLFGTLPCGGMIAAFTVILGGNVALTVLVTTLSYLLSLVMVPFWTKLLIGQVVPVSPLLMLKYLFMIIVIPWVMADLTRRPLLKAKGDAGFQAVRKKLLVLPGIGLVVLLFTVFVLNGRNLLAEPALILKIMLPAGSFLIVLILIAWSISRLLNLSYADSTAMIMSTTAKNNAVAMALALSAFGTDVGMVIAFTGPITQFPIMLTFLKIAQTRMK